MVPTFLHMYSWKLLREGLFVLLTSVFHGFSYHKTSQAHLLFLLSKPGILHFFWDAWFLLVGDIWVQGVLMTVLQVPLINLGAVTNNYKEQSQIHSRCTQYKHDFIHVQVLKQ